MTLGVWPYYADPKTLTRQVWDSTTARGLPGMARALGLYGMIGTCPLELDKGGSILPAGAGPGTGPRILDRPDPDMARITFVNAHVEDYWLHGNALHLVTTRYRDGSPAAARWFPANKWYVIPDDQGQPTYHLDGRRVNRDDVVHVRRGADPLFPYRGVGVVEQHLRTLNRIGLEEAAESATLTDRGMPSVAVITPNAEGDEVAYDAAAEKWVERFQGATPKPAFFPKDTHVIPLSWNPSDSQMVEARRMSITDLANVMNLDGYWLGAPGSSHTYKSPGPLFLALLKTSLTQVMDVLEDEWSAAWFPHGSRVRFRRVELLRDDLSTMVGAFNTGSRFFPDPNEPREYMGFPALPEDAFPAPVAAPAPAPAPAPEDEDEVDDTEAEADAPDEELIPA